MYRHRSSKRAGRTARGFRGLGFALALAAMFLAGAAALGQQPQKSSCVVCHSNLEGRLKDPVTKFAHDIHNSRGLSCNDCHGGDPTKSDKAAAKSIAAGYLGTPKPSEIPAFCGKCHSDAGVMKRFNPSLRVDQVQEYLTSIHGKRLKEGDTKVATCISCHGNHGIRSAKDPLSSVYPLNVAETCSKCHANADYMAQYNIAHNQYDRYKKSVHANALYEKKDISAPTCNDCHGNHGAAPPGIASVANVCGQCHSRQSELFQKSPHKAAFDRMGIAECVRCHNNHEIQKPTDQMIGIGKGSVCVSCHNGDKGFESAKAIQASMSDLRTNIDKAEDILDRAERAGMEVSRPKFELQEATDALTTARVVIHTVSTKEVIDAAEPGKKVAIKSYKAGQDAFSELSFRRQGLAVSLVFIGFLAVLVYLKIRQIEGRDSSA
jgi:hypothetical protein